MVLLDPTERLLIDNLSVLSPTILPGLEERTGADLALSIWDAPARTNALAWAHVDKGAGYQLKRGVDIVGSVKDGRLMSQLTRMLEWWQSPWLVHIADVGVSQEGHHLYIDGRYADRGNFDARAYVSTMRSWQRAGGKWITLPRGYSFIDWVRDELRRMERDRDERLVCRSSQDVKLYPLTPQEETLACFPKIGPAKAHALWESMVTPSLLSAITMLTSGMAEEVPGIGKGIVKLSREFLGMTEGDVLSVERRE